MRKLIVKNTLQLLDLRSLIFAKLVSKKWHKLAKLELCKRKVCIRIWLPTPENGSSVGHVSLETYAGDELGNGIYASFYPDAKDKILNYLFIKRGRFLVNSDADEDAHNFQPANITLILCDLDVDKINKAFLEFKASNHPYYLLSSLFFKNNTKNCSNLVEMLLEKGGIFETVMNYPQITSQRHGVLTSITTAIVVGISSYIIRPAPTHLYFVNWPILSSPHLYRALTAYTKYYAVNLLFNNYQPYPISDKAACLAALIASIGALFPEKITSSDIIDYIADYLLSSNLFGWNYLKVTMLIVGVLCSNLLHLYRMLPITLRKRTVTPEDLAILVKAAIEKEKAWVKDGDIDLTYESLYLLVDSMRICNLKGKEWLFSYINGAKNVIKNLIYYNSKNENSFSYAPDFFKKKCNQAKTLLNKIASYRYRCSYGS